jgi:catechol 2,3-dioxygenase-like lactoylglutathione lyase family enzyme
MAVTNKEFEFCGVNHLALVCKDMAKTVEFYRDILGMPLMNGDSLAFFWFPGAPEAVPGVSAPEALPTKGNFMSAHGSMNHIAINVPAERFDEYYERLVEKGVEVTPILNHDNSPTQSSPEMNDDVYVRSVYFFDPDGVCLEFAAWTKVFDDSDVAHDPVRADGTKAEGMITGRTPVPAE